VREEPARFEKLVLPHLNAAYRLARPLVKRHEDAQDVVQDAYIKALKGFKPWLTARLDFAPPLVGTPASGYSLIGGRVDVIENRSVVTLIYRHDDDVVSLFCWLPDKEHLSTSERSIDGYRVATWSNAQCNYVLVSQLSDLAMHDFMDSFRVRIQSGSYF
jgi:anti-sigma factor RsiW